MKRYVLVSLGLVLFAILLTIVVFVLLQMTPELTTGATSFVQPQAPTEEVVMDTGTSTAMSLDGASTTYPYATTTVVLSEAQIKQLETVDLNVSTVTITPTQYQCAVDVLGVRRVAEIEAGDTLSLIEIARLAQCR